MARYSSSSWRAFRPGGTPPRSRPEPTPDMATTRAVPAGEWTILGLDPGSQRTGFGIIQCSARGERHVASGCIDVAGQEMVRRLRQIYERVSELAATHQPDMVAIESIFVHRNPGTALILGQARGVALCAAAIGGASVHEYAPRAIKLAVTGYGAAVKPQVGAMVCTLLKLTAPLPADAADALAVALCHAQSRRLQSLGLAGTGA